ncbi:Hypothetical protein D9617_1g079750 [Elsinoe fawcettii]|nr:Hypothetical protein D9617_1g079750 [Elsinoe fawcettii]
MFPPTTTAESPLPDSSALEAGLIADTRTPNPDGVQNDVRHLLLDLPLSGRLVYSDVCRSPLYTPETARSFNDDIKCRSVFEEYAAIDEHVESPKKEGTYAPSLLEYYSRSPRVDLETGMALFPPYDKRKDKIPTIAYRRRKKRRTSVDRDHRFRFLTCIVLACFLAALVAAYVSQAVPPRILHPALHAVFVVSIVFNSVLLAYYTSRLTRFAPVPRHLWAVRPHHRRHRHTRRHHHRRRWPSTPSCSSAASITSTSGLLRTPTPLRPSPRAHPIAQHTSQRACPTPVAVVEISQDRLLTPPAARTARSSIHSTYLGEFYLQDMKPLSSPASPERPNHSPFAPRVPSLATVPEMQQVPTLSSLSASLHPAPLSIRPLGHTITPISSHTTIIEATQAERLTSATYTPAPNTSHPTYARVVPARSPMTPGLPFIEDEAEEGSILIQAPPPAYGRWRGSVRVDPDLLSWRGLRREDVERGLPDYERDGEVVEIRVDEDGSGGR